MISYGCQKNSKMLHEETESGRVATRTDSRMVNDRRKGSRYLHPDQNYSDEDNEIQYNTTEYEVEDEEREIDGHQGGQEGDVHVQEIDIDREQEGREEVENKGNDEDEQLGECAVCHITVTAVNLGGSIADTKQNSGCFEGYLLCQRCVQGSSIRSGAEYLQFQRSYANFLQGRDDNRDQGSRITYNSSAAMYLQSPQTHLESRRGQWICDNLNEMDCPVEQISEEIDDGEISNIVSYIGPRKDYKMERECGKQCQLQQRDYGNLSTRRNDADRYSCEIKVKDMSYVDYSRRPIRCPRLDCSVNVAFSALTHHFLFDHPEVPILSVEPGAESKLIVSYEALVCNSSRCLALLLVSGKLSDSTARLFGGNQINPKYRNRLPLPVLAARLHCNRYGCCKEVHAGGEGQCEKDMIIAWVAGLDVGDTADRLRCSIQAVDNVENGGFRSLTYTGPVMSLRATQCPRDVFLTGDCIVLHEGLIGHITSGCTSLNVNVTVY